VIVIGGGIVGACTALWLLRVGQQVTVIDRAGWAGGTRLWERGRFGSGLDGAGDRTRPDPKSARHGFESERALGSCAGGIFLGCCRGSVSTSRMPITPIRVVLAPIVAETVDQHRALAEGSPAVAWLEESYYSFAYASEVVFQADAYA